MLGHFASHHNHLLDTDNRDPTRHGTFELLRLISTRLNGPWQSKSIAFSALTWAVVFFTTSKSPWSRLASLLSKQNSPTNTHFKLVRIANQILLQILGHPHPHSLLLLFLLTPALLYLSSGIPLTY
jgi:hypothetical protein